MLKKIISYIKDPKKIIIYMMNKNIMWFLPDKVYLKIKYKLMMGKKLNIDNPKTFNEKLQWLKLYDRKDIYTKMVDKYEAKKFVKKIIGEDYIVETLGIYDKFEDIDFEKLPSKFVIKPTHASGNVYICKDKSKIDYKALKKEISKWLKRDYYKIHREWPYKNVERRIIIEKYLSEFEDDDIRDYKFYMFNNKLAFSFVCSDRKKDVKFTFYDRNGKFMDVTQCGKPYDKRIKLPQNYERMIQLSEKLSKNTIALRVDFYEINGKIYFGELTFFDSAGFGPFNPDEWDEKIGDWLILPRK